MVRERKSCRHDLLAPAYHDTFKLYNYLGEVVQKRDVSRMRVLSTLRDTYEQHFTPGIYEAELGAKFFCNIFLQYFFILDLWLN